LIKALIKILYEGFVNSHKNDVPHKECLKKEKNNNVFSFSIVEEEKNILKIKKKS